MRTRITVVSRASAHSRVSAHVPGSLLQLPYKHMKFISQVSAHAGQNRELCLSAHGRLPGTLRYMYTRQCVMHITHMLRVHTYHIQDIDGDIQDAWLSAPQLMSRS